MDKHYNLQKIRTLLSEGFTPEELRRLCQDEPSFRPVCHQLTRNSSKAEIIDLIIEHADRMLQFETLLAWAKESNPARYNLHQPYSSTPDLTPASGVPAEANSRTSPQAVGESGVPDTSPRNNMPDIPSHLSGRLRQALLDCGPFDNDRQLRAVFADDRLSPWRYSLPQADSLTSRVDAIIDFLHTRQRSDTKANALVLLLQVLSERIDPGDACHQTLKDLADELEGVLGTGLGSTTPAESPGDARGALRWGDSRPPSAPPLNPIRDRWALLVGIDRYNDSNFAPLNFCVNDVVALQEVLEGLGYRVLALHDQAAEARLLPTKDNIEAELIGLCEAVGSNDLLWVHFACHGQLVNDQPILITQQTRARTLANSGLPVKKVEEQMKASQASRLVLTLDACHVGIEMGRGGSDPEFNRHVYDLAQGFALIAASTAQQKAQEWREKKHGVFTYYLLEGLSGQADRDTKQFVTVADLKNYVLNGLRIWNPLHGGLLQEPTARTEGLGDMILADFREPRPGGAQP